MNRSDLPDDANTVYQGLVESTLRLLDALADAEPRAQVMAPALQTVREAADAVEDLPKLSEDLRLAAHDARNPRFAPDERGLTPAVRFEKQTSDSIAGVVTFGARFRGSGAVHGGAVTLFFDDFLGRLANAGNREVLARTAYLRVDYRQVTPVGTELHAEAWIDRTEGRKRFLRGRLEDGKTVLAEAEGLWVDERDGAHGPRTQAL